jgi:hypothetical protein
MPTLQDLCLAKALVRLELSTRLEAVTDKASVYHLQRQKAKNNKHCSDQLDPFCIERGFPAEREIGERENNGSFVHNTGQDLSVSTSPPPPSFNQLIRAVISFATSPLTLSTPFPPLLHVYIIQRPYAGSRG